MQQQQQIVADASAAASAGLAAVTWVAQLNEILQLTATVVAIVAGAGAAWWHIEKARAARHARLKHRGEHAEGDRDS